MVTRIIKLGGSLLELTDWAGRLQQWLAHQTQASNLIVVGGGERVESLRVRQPVDGFSDEWAHVKALQLMDENAADVASALSGSIFVRNWQPDRVLSAGKVWVLECGAWAAGDPVYERSWRTTSDSVAAEIAARLRADELALLKSCLPGKNIDSVVDPRFQDHVGVGQLVRVVNLRAVGFPEITWRKVV